MRRAPSSPDEERRKRRDDALRSLDEMIGEHLEQARRSGELQAAPGFGRPLSEPEGWAETPVEFRLPFKILKNAGVAPPELDLFRQSGALRQRIEAGGTAAELGAWRQQLAEVEQRLALRLEGLRVRGRL